MNNFNTDFLSGKKGKGFYQNTATVIKKLVERHGEQEFKTGLNHILNGLRNAYPKIMEDTTIPIPPRLKAVFETVFEEAYGIKPTSEGINSFCYPPEVL